MPTANTFSRPGKPVKKGKLTVIVSAGSSSIVDEVTHEPKVPILSQIVDTVVKLKRDGHRVVIVSSGAIAVGLQKMNIPKKPKHLPQKQALAAIGQCRLMTIWDNLFTMMGQPVAQILLTRNDIVDHSQYINAQNTLNQVLAYGVIPIVNENDTVAVSEIRFGDNDTLSANTAAMIHADYLFLLTDVPALYDKNPRLHADAKPVRTVENIQDLEVDIKSSGSDLGTGGMETKITAARIATSVGTTTIITNSSEPGKIKDIIGHFHPAEIKQGSEISLLQPKASSEPPLHTRFLPSSTRVRDRAFWILHSRVPQGTIYIDRGAGRALQSKAGLLPVGIVDVVGDFSSEEAVRIVMIDRPSSGPLSQFGDSLTAENGNSSPTPALMSRSQILELSHEDFEKEGTEIARAIVNYNSLEIKRIKGLKSNHISHVLGYEYSEYVAFRTNVSLLAPSRPQTPRPASFINVINNGGGSVTPGVDKTGGGGTPEASIADLRAGH